MFDSTDYYKKVKDIAQRTSQLTEDITKTQSDESLSRSQHIGVYRTNTKALEEMRSEIWEMERILDRRQGKVTTEPVKTRFNAPTPTKTATWLVIFGIVGLLAVISFMVFFSWHKKSQANDEVITNVSDKQKGPLS